ncbi:MAG: glycosyltransferase [Firmicutes bacterium]|nr:glycosyltransferase [Bacillota bacterium]MCL5971006.1 glycosyltransferase [Bacillota bacterium]
MDPASVNSPTTAELAEWVNWLPNHHDATLAMHPEVMILAARYGDGHLRAAKAIALQLLLLNPSIKLGILDYYRFVNPKLDHTIRWAYLNSVRFAPSLWRWFYTATQRIDPLSSTQQFLNHIGLTRFYDAISATPPKIIVSTYPTAAGVVSTLKQAGKLDVINYVVMTDYSVHSQWIHPAVDGYFVGSEDMKDELLARGIAPDKITVSGIPVDERFKEMVDAMAVRQRYGIDDHPVILFMGGSYMPLVEFEKILRVIDEIPNQHTTLVIAGREMARQRIARGYREHSKNAMVVLNYVDNVHELMAVADLLVSKAGGLTTTESLCRGLPVVIYRPIPGQEDANAEFLVRHGAGRRAKTEEEVGELITYLLQHPWEIRAMARQSGQLGHPEAATAIALAIDDSLVGRRAHAPA